MAIMKNIAAFFVCFALLVSGVANAAMPCCMTDADQPKAEMQMDHGGMDMPCHETADNDQQDSSNGCSGCDCQHCVKMTALPEHPTVKEVLASNVRAYTTQSIHSRQPEGVFQPPKHIS